MRTRLRTGIGALLALAALAPTPLRADALDYAGSVLSRREVERLARTARATAADSLSVRTLLGLVVGRLQDLGHLDARAVAERAPGRIALAVHEGRRYTIGALALHLPFEGDSARFASVLELAVGATASPRAARVAIERAVAAVVDLGFAYAEAGVTGWEADSGAVRVTVSGALGPRVTVSRVRVDGLAATRPALVEKTLGRMVGAPYDRAAAVAGRDRLAQLGLFRSVEGPSVVGEGDWSRASVVYRVEEPRYNRFEGAAGVQGEGEVVGRLRLDMDNLLGTGRALGIGWDGRGRDRTDLAARYVEPLLFGTPLRVEGNLLQQVQDTSYVRTRWGGRLGLPLGQGERIEAGYDEERVVQEDGPVAEAALQHTSFGIARDGRHGGAAARAGTRLAVTGARSFKRERLRPEGSRTARAGAVEVDADWLIPVGRGAGLSLGARAAGRFSSERVLPSYERYPVGGAASVRGHDEEALRADRYALGRLEWRWYLGTRGARAFAFWDHALAATREALPEGGDRLARRTLDGIGMGLRLEAAGGLVGIDYGLEPGRTPLEGKLHLQLVSTF